MKKLLIGLGGFVILLIAAALIGPSFYDWNSFKPEIAAQVKQATGRDLTIDGDISLSILPTPSLSAEGVRFANAEGGSAPAMASLEALRVRIAFTPLLQGAVQVESVTLVAPTILLEKLPDGSGNWEITPPTGEAPAAGEPAGEDGTLDVSLDSLAIENGTLIYRDAAAGTEERLDAVEATVSASSLRGPFRASGEARLRGIPLAFEASTGTLAPAQPVPLSISLTVPESEARAMFGGALQTGGAEGASLTGRLQVEGPSLAKLAAAMAPGAALPAVLADGFAVDGQVEYRQPIAEIRDLTLRLGETTAAGTVTVETSGPLFVRTELKVNRLDLDRLIGPPSADGDAAAAAPQPAETAPAAPAPAEPFVLPREIAGELLLTVDAITYGGGVISNAQLSAALAEGEIAITRASALLPGGSDLALAGTIDTAEGTPRFAGAVEGSSDNLRSLLDWLKTPLPAGIASERLRQLSMTGRITATPTAVQVADIDLRIDTSRVTGGLAIALPEAGVRVKPGFGIGLAVDKLNLDAYLGQRAAAEPEAAAEPAAGTEAAAGQDAAGDAATQPAQPAEPSGLPLHVLRPLATFDANIELRVGSLTYNAQTLQGLHLDGTLHAGNLVLRDLSVQEFAGGRGAVSGQVTDLAGDPRFDTTFDLGTGDAGRVLQFAGIDVPGRDRLGRLELAGTLAGGRDDVTYDASFSIGGIGAEGQARGTAQGLSGGIPRIDTDLTVKARDAGPLLEIAGLAGAAEAKLGALDLTGTASSGADDLTYDLSFSLTGIEGRGQLAGTIRAISSETPQVDTKLDISAAKPAALLRLVGIDGGTAANLGALGIVGTMQGGADAMTLDLGLTGLGGQAKLAGTVAAVATPATFDLSVEADHPELRQLIRAVAPDYRPSSETLGPFRLVTRASGSTADATLSDLRIQSGSSELGGTVTYDATGPRPMILAALTSNALDITGFLPAEDGGGSGGNADGSGGAEGGRWSREPLDLSALDAVDADIDLTADSVTMDDIRVDQLQAKLQLRDGTLEITHLNGNTMGGMVGLTGQLAGRGVPSASGKLTVTNLDVGQLLESGLLGSRITGPVSVNADLNTMGLSMAELVQGLNGTGRLGGDITVLTQVEEQVGSALLDLLGGKVKQIRGITDTVGNVFGAFAGQTSKLTGDFVITDGTLTTENTQIENANALLALNGQADLAAWTVDMLAQIYRAAGGEPYLAVDLTGALDAPNPRFTGGGLSGDVPAPNQGLGGILQQVVPGEDGDAATGTGGLGGILRDVVPQDDDDTETDAPAATTPSPAEPAPPAPAEPAPAQPAPAEPAPEPAAPAPSAEPAPDAEPEPAAPTAAPEAAEPVPEAAEPPPEAIEPAPEAAEPAPEATEPAPEADAPAPERSAPAPAPDAAPAPETVPPAEPGAETPTESEAEEPDAVPELPQELLPQDVPSQELPPQELPPEELPQQQ